LSAKKVDAASKCRLRAKLSARHKTENFAKFDSNYCQQHRDFKDSNYVIVICILTQIMSLSFLSGCCFSI